MTRLLGALRRERVGVRALAVATALASVAVGTASAADGGISTDGDTTRRSCTDSQYGQRTLERGDCGADVKTLNWILRAKVGPVSLNREYDDETTTNVRRFERRQDIRVNGVVERRTRRALAREMNRHRATWYGPGFFGNRTACGQTLRRKTRGVAHKRLPCGTKLVVRYKGRYTRAKVIDRGPYANHARWDLTQKTARLIGFEGTDDVRVAVIR